VHEWTGSSTWYHFSHWSLTHTHKKKHNTVASLEHFIIQVLASAMLLLIAVTKTLTEDVFIFPESPYMPIIICTPLLLQAEWTSVPPNADRRITLLEKFPKTLPGIEPGTSTNCGAARQEDKYSYLLDRRLGGTKSSLVAVVYRKTFTHSGNRTAASWSSRP